jgi:hypothetical protein
MKKPTKSFAAQYPYLTYWIEDWGYMRIGNDYDFPYGKFLMLLDQGGTCYQGDAEKTLDEAFEKAEKFLREVDFPERFDKETIDSLEAEYTLLKVK